MKNKIDHTIFYLLALFTLSVIVFSLLIPDIFWSVSNFQSMASQISVLGILTLAMALPMLTGGINLSIIASMNACSLVIAYFITQYTSMTWLLFSVVLSFLCAFVIGLLNGTLIAIIRVSPILATLGTMTLINGINILVTNGSTIANFPQSILNISASTILWLPIPILIFLLLAGLIWLFLEKTAMGKAVYFIGNNAKAADYSGINTKKILIWVYIISSVLCVFAAILMMSKLNSAKASYGDSYLLISILATVLGGINPDGGKGKLLGILLALVLLQVIESGLNMLGISSYITMILWGSILLLFIFLQKNRLFQVTH
ncbi:monosaccharide ABC transporter membrane protein (CUT2 family) [Nicoletella semolina]|uniref:Monosaccharide ABC transporter membrane protein (CUT2 family) n=1 Tax=Nicoletella semolina TaxID=271160 RepID=A0A4R2N8P0_9PAST|nr:ABC transporter permease [Nicoletella semolina]MDH2924531.1 sugar ABC transporter permease [Nicoletella semolina]TCP17341.1 monosaccharide ABC transporter membrane protein (CUT2 family) [Nicoletella semolina]